MLGTRWLLFIEFLEQPAISVSICRGAKPPPTSTFQFSFRVPPAPRGNSSPPPLLSHRYSSVDEADIALFLLVLAHAQLLQVHPMAVADFGAATASQRHDFLGPYDG